MRRGSHRRNASETGASEDADDDWGGDDWGDESSADAGIALNPIDQTISFSRFVRTTGSEGSITVEELFDAESLEFTSDEFLKRIQTNQFAVENLVSEDFRYSALLVQTEPMEDVVNTKFYFALKSVVEAESKTDFTLDARWARRLIAQMDQDTQKNIGAITMAALLVMSIVLLDTLPLLVSDCWSSDGRHHWVDLVVRVHGMDRCDDELRECHYSGLSDYCGACRCNPSTVELCI